MNETIKAIDATDTADIGAGTADAFNTAAAKETDTVNDGGDTVETGITIESHDAYVRRDHKDTLFRMLFSDKKELLGLYNALNKTEYTNVDDLTITTLENAIYLSVKNDISFIFQFNLYLYEHQSTINPNIPLRDLFYLSDLLQGLIRNNNIYSSKLIRIPEPKFVVFYNGTTEQDDILEYRLSNMFFRESDDPDIDLRVLVLNINENHNPELMAACRTLSEYARLVQRIRDNCKTLPIQDSVIKAVNDCIRDGILKDFLLKHKAEAIKMSIYEFDAEQYARFLREEGAEEGHAKGLEEGHAKGLEEGRAEERLNTEREKARADAAEARVKEAEQEIARLKAKL